MSTLTTAERTALERAVLVRWREGGCAGLIADAVAAERKRIAEKVRGLTPHHCWHGEGASVHLTLWIEDVLLLIEPPL